VAAQQAFEPNGGFGEAARHHHPVARAQAAHGPAGTDHGEPAGAGLKLDTPLAMEDARRPKGKAAELNVHTGPRDQGAGVDCRDARRAEPQAGQGRHQPDRGTAPPPCGRPQERGEKDPRRKKQTQLARTAPRTPAER